MGQYLRKLDIMALTASAEAAKKLRLFLIGLKEDVISALATGESPYHKNYLEESTETTADCTDQATAIVLANSLKAKVNAHLASTLNEGVHRVASAEVIASDDATDATTLYALANELKADYNTHLTESGVHIADDSTNDVTSADATTEGTAVTLLNEIKSDYNAHVLSTMAAGIVQE